MIQALPGSRILFDEPMRHHTSFRIGGPADALVLPGSVEDLRAAIRFARGHQAPLTITGNGSNLLVRDGGLRGIVIKLGDCFNRIQVEECRITAQSGALLADVSRTAGAHSLTGLEFAIGIPGTLGGAVLMNAGAYGGEMKDVVTRVTALDESGELHELDPEALQFGYRRSALQQLAWTVAETEMQLQPGDPAQIQAKMADLTFQRESKQPLEFPSAGSVFKRPPGRYVGPMVEELGLKGYRIGDAQISEKHAGFIINRGNALAHDVLALIEHVRERVKSTYDVWLETEVRIIGEDEAPETAAGGEPSGCGDAETRGHEDSVSASPTPPKLSLLSPRSAPESSASPGSPLPASP
jgi:UDP-N-acetylmuramate dehydrogenase